MRRTGGFAKKVRAPGLFRPMKSNLLAASAVVFSLGTCSMVAEAIRLNDGTLLEGTPGAPTEISVHTASGERRVAFSQLPVQLQKLYWTAPAVAAPSIPTPATAPVTVGVADEDLGSLANEVSLETWAQVAAIGSFRDKPDKRGPGGLVVTKGFNALEENWASVYSPKDPVGTAGHWNEQLGRARVLVGRNPQFLQRRWLELFIKAGEAVARRDSTEFALAVRELKRSPLSLAGAGTATASNGAPAPGLAGGAENSSKIFSAK